jgi:hypothetical protein
VTEKKNVPPLAGTRVLVGSIDAGHAVGLGIGLGEGAGCGLGEGDGAGDGFGAAAGFPLCSIGIVCSAARIMAWRVESAVFSDTTNVTVCVPLPVAVLTTIHDSVDAAVHGHWASVAMILSSKVPPNAPML